MAMYCVSLLHGVVGLIYEYVSDVMLGLGTYVVNTMMIS